MLTGSVPFTGDAALEIAQMHVAEKPPPPLELNPALHPAFLPVLDKALQKEPSDRYQSGEELSAALRQAVVAAISDPQPTEMGQLHISSLSATEKVNEIRDRRYQADDITPVNLSLNKLTMPTIGESLYDQLEDHERARQRKRGLSFSSLGAAMLGIGIVLMLLLLNRQASDPEPSATALEQAGLSAFTPTAAVTDEGTEPQMPALTSTAMSPTAAALSPTPIAVISTAVTAEAAATEDISTPPAAVALRFVTNGDDSLYIMNISPLPLQLDLLELRGSQSSGMVGSEWGVATLNNQECVRVLRDENAFSPNITCNVVGNLITQNGAERFWQPEFDAFEVYYGGALIGSCPTAGCVLPIPVSAL
jgi:hypothetical protein